ncbi:MAG: hypothetical protein K9L75_04850 [Spirochaetia bacterium]|nr:hypothetical protein [Spirochaetia bacterium]
MNKIILIFVVLLVSFPAFSSEPQENNENLINDRAWMNRPLATVMMGFLGGFDLIGENQQSYTEKFALTSIMETGFIDRYTFSGLNYGPQYNLTGKYLDGIYIGIFPGICWIGDGTNSKWGFSTMLEFGFQSIHETVAWGAYMGYTYTTIDEELQFKFGLKIGYAYSSD